MPPPKHFPFMNTPPDRIDSLAWYYPDTYGLEAMEFEGRGGEIVPLRWPDHRGSGMIGVPPSLARGAPHFYNVKDDRRSVGNHEFEATFTSTLRPEQVPFVDGVFNTLENELGCIGEAPTGFGKTTTGCNLIAHLGRTTCIVIPKGDLDWKPELLGHTNIPENRIDFWSGGSLPSPDAWVVIASLQSVYRLGHYPKEVYDRFGCLIVDEVHRIGSPEFANLMRQFPAMWKLGLSATPERRDGKMDLIHSCMGWTHVVGHSDAEQPDYYVIPSEWQEPINSAGKVTRYDPSRTNHAKRSLMADTVRNAKIAGAIYRAHKGDRRTIVFVEQIKHGERIRAALLAMGVPGYRIIQYNGGISKEDKARAKECPPGIILIATYKYTAEGTNIPPLDCAVLAHPIWDPRQAVGRIKRKHPNKPRPIVLDVWDPLCPTLDHIAKNRWEYLRKQGATWKGTFG